MKRLVKILIFTLCALMLFCISASAKGLDSQELKAYVGEKIMPIVAGVFTSVLALIGTLKSIFKSLKELKDTREDLGKTQNEIKEKSAMELEEIKQKYEQIKELLCDVPELKGDLEALLEQSQVLILQLGRLSKIASLGFLQSAEVVKSGKGKEIARLAEQNQEVENEAS